MANAIWWLLSQTKINIYQKKLRKECFGEVKNTGGFHGHRWLHLTQWKQIILRLLTLPASSWRKIVNPENITLLKIHRRSEAVIC
jgi:hypothetical protein